ADRQGIARLVQGRGDGGLVAPGDGDELGDRAEDLVLVRGRLPQRLDPVLAAEAELEGLEPRLRRLPVAIGGPAGLDDPLDLRLGLVVGLRGLLVPLVEALLAALLVGDRALEAGELLLGLLRPRESGRDALLEATDLGLAGLDPGAAGAHLPGEPR